MRPEEDGDLRMFPRRRSRGVVQNRPCRESLQLSFVGPVLELSENRRCPIVVEKLSNVCWWKRDSEVLSLLVEDGAVFPKRPEEDHCFQTTEVQYCFGSVEIKNTDPSNLPSC